MYDINYYFILSGKCFSPKQLEKLLGVKLEEKTEPGEIQDFGRFRNKPSPHGSAILPIEISLGLDSENGMLDQLLIEKLSTHNQGIKKLGVDEMIFHMDVAFKDQCNFEISNAVLKELYELGVTVAITCFEVQGQ